MEDLFRHLHMSYELACQFLAVFSRMEYALKSTGYAIGSENRIEANWDRFANEIDGEFLRISDEAVVSARNYLLRLPPRKQILKDGRIDFKDQTICARQKATQQVLLMVRTVRNNLFHGGKFLPGGEEEPGRNEALVKHAILVLQECSRLKTDVYANFQM